MNLFYTIYRKNIYFVCVQKRLHETFLLRKQNICLIENKTANNFFSFFEGGGGGIYSYVYLPIIRTLDTSK